MARYRGEATAATVGAAAAAAAAVILARSSLLAGSFHTWARCMSVAGWQSCGSAAMPSQNSLHRCSQVAIKVMDYYAPADGSAFQLTAEKHSALLEVGRGPLSRAQSARSRVGS